MVICPVTSPGSDKDLETNGGLNYLDIVGGERSRGLKTIVGITQSVFPILINHCARISNTQRRQASARRSCIQSSINSAKFEQVPQPWTRTRNDEGVTLERADQLRFRPHLGSILDTGHEIDVVGTRGDGWRPPEGEKKNRQKQLQRQTRPRYFHSSNPTSLAHLSRAQAEEICTHSSGRQGGARAT
jgi:hypothetical protein